MPRLNLKQTFITIVLIGALLAALAMGILKTEVAHSESASPRGAHALAWYCPPPPIPC